MKIINGIKIVMAVLVMLGVVGVSDNLVAQEKKKVEEITIKTSVVCGMCKDRVEKNMAYEKGVKAVEVDLETKEVTIKYKTDKTNPDQLRKAITKIGYDADDMEADAKAYEKLPACCKKGVAPH